LKNWMDSIQLSGTPPMAGPHLLRGRKIAARIAA
jgi:hypothetical protein